ncbi:MAG: hypothetical protein AAF718_11520 [Pseudomonadota bacterium]
MVDSYLEPEPLLSDITLKWMIDELKACISGINIDENMLVTSPDPLGMQHEETYMFEFRHYNENRR